jgi:hypothetical protein
VFESADCCDGRAASGRVCDPARLDESLGPEQACRSSDAPTSDTQANVTEINFFIRGDSF